MVCLKILVFMRKFVKLIIGEIICNKINWNDLLYGWYFKECIFMDEIICIDSKGFE